MLIMVEFSPSHRLRWFCASIGRVFPLKAQLWGGLLGVKHSLEALKGAHLLPFWGDMVGGGRHCLKPVIKYDVELWGDVASVQIANQTNVLGMHWRNSNKLGPAGPWLPLGNLSSSGSKLGLQDIGWATPWVCQLQSLVIAQGAGKYLNGCLPSLHAWSVVVQMGSIGHC